MRLRTSWPVRSASILVLILNLSASRSAFAAGLQDLCAKVSSSGHYPGPPDVCMAVAFAITGQNCNAFEYYDSYTSTRDVCLGAQVAISKKNCNTLEEYNSLTSPRDFCIGFRQALNGKSCATLKSFEYVTGPKDICFGTQAALNAADCEKSQVFNGTYNTSPRDTCTGLRPLLQKLLQQSASNQSVFIQ